MKAKIIGTGSYLPEKRLTNEAFCGMVDTSDEWITTRTGIKERRVTEGESGWQMSVKSAKSALADAGVAAEELDAIVCSSVTADYLFPAMSCIVQRELGAVNAVCWDVNAACSGFMYALDAVRDKILLGKCKTALVISTECLSRVTDYTDRSTCVLFGDGSGAAVVQAAEDGIEDVLLMSDGNGADALQCRVLRKETPFTDPANFTKIGDRTQETSYLKMDGREVFRFAVTAVPELVQRILDRHGLSSQDIAYLVPHQANVRILQSAAKKLNMPAEKFAVNLDRYGNTSSASVPILLDELVKSGKVKRGDRLILVAFGAGYTAGAALMTW